MSFNSRFKLVFFVPPLNLQQCKAAIFAAGGGRFNKYSECCFTTPGIGQFKPDDAAKPAIGEAGKVEEVGEVKCEIQCSEVTISEAVSALKK